MPPRPARPRPRSRHRSADAVALVGIVGVLAFAGCGADVAPTTQPSGQTDVGGGQDVLFNNPFGDVAARVDAAGEDVGAGSDAAADVAADAGDPGAGCEFPANPGVGEPGASCEQGSDCDSGYCLDAPGGKRCTRTCIDCCPQGWACEVAPKSDTLYLCVPKLKALCRPCVDDAFCAAIAKDALCIAAGDASVGAFCGGGCIEDDDCPAGYGCVLSSGSQGSSKQCVLDAGECACSSEAIAAGDSTSCTLSNAHGTCTGSRKCTQSGLGACDAAAPAAEVCNGQDDDCDGATDEGLAGDACEVSNAYGVCVGATTCDGASVGCDAATPAAEVCNGQDDDCDGATDEGLAGAACEIANAAGTCPGTTACDGAVLLCEGVSATAEACNSKDDDCDGATDEGFADSDNDGLADCVDGDDDADGTPDIEDCAPLDAKISPAATELCNGKDDDCDGLTDEADAVGCGTFYADADKDGAGAAASSACLCAASAAYPVAIAGDCDDADAASHPLAVETCGGKDEDCDGKTDEADAQGCAVLYLDADKDGVGTSASSQCLCAPSGDISAALAGDCDDGDPAIKPGAVEACNGKDDNCQDGVDEQGAKGCVDHYVDADKDGFGVADGAQCLCAPNASHSATVAGDCDDGDKAINAKQGEGCNGKDDDCDGSTDEPDALGCNVLWADVDQDGFGKPGDTACLCKAKVPYTATKAGDCDDNQQTVAPGAVEACNGKDDDCDGATDPVGAKGCDAYFVDADKDGYGDSYAPTKCLCAPAAPHSALKGGDCKDGDAAVHVDAIESCDDKDNNCNGVTDEIGAKGCKDTYIDNDNDGYGVSGSAQCMCKPKAPFSALVGGDCQDNDGNIHPKAAEQCNGKDDDCNGATDDGASGKVTYYLDNDGDGWGVAGSSQSLCAPTGKYTAKNSGDCLDNDAAVHPGAAEIQCNGKDDDCVGGDACVQQCSGVCGGKCGSSLQQTYCLIALGNTCLLEDYCYCDNFCKTAGDCCPGRATCCP